MVNGRLKGNKAELDVCRQLSEWWDEKDYVGIRAENLPFRRSPLSGGWDRKRAAGDIIKPKSCLLCFEVKKREEWSWDRFFKDQGKQWSVFRYWLQTVEATKEGEIPILLFTKNRFPWYVAMEAHMFNALKIKPFLKASIEDTTIGFGFLDVFFKVVNRKNTLIRKKKV